ncbi:Helix-turn-helix domain-containing protein OS=Tsukamurella paurometabola (strain ATCC 8368 / DSM/ CCUG 35730 / CIP 100753 / JCM 10117 / KCTC 9821 / NBRC 16120 / NCIMB 702349 / NCTC 13040) OX=521096 GN=Tpau_3886 PE=4 SV=1 [Tsukamurella paurometabola]|uniref:Helix-turn-helix domain-containing protein n=1 Tax=Tsukamurella paurometabola (strain ATCC 8368 / DSM 20162 / CCUG 35730 / CIP 100753 / JCM 10117 / KCTC 9821 / NBRC 16120 / NCIMB 702349 / NCTC 13040) TaxID=521096 RepID=D5UMI5_TSUPD|nr:helix-turn-helix domain-containing protein [Tsukamurella paurometabola]ADG80459.1 conserved hypothetical protein [Tsukamurella paurometabola DSM 20162]SUP39722.1 Uncharacterised protein [Tsukamurella paurometabola]
MTYDNDDIVTTTQLVAARPFLNANTLRWYRANGTGPHSFKVGKHVYYRLGDVDRWLSEQETATGRGGAA